MSAFKGIAAVSNRGICCSYHVWRQREPYDFSKKLIRS